MKFTYFPGCTLKNKAKELDLYARQAAEALGVTLEEAQDWQCCGGVFTSSEDEIATKLSCVRLLKGARDKGQPLVTVCSACHNVVKQTNFAMQNNEDFARKVNLYMNEETDYNGECQVYHYLELLRDVIGFDKLSERVTAPLKGKRIAAYYGCLLLRPHKVIGLCDPENPTVMEDMIKALGADPVYYGRRNECCGGYTVMENPALARKNSLLIAENAKASGADMIVTACPLCYYNLKKSGADIPVYYFTELLCEALGLKEAANEQ